MNRRTMKTVLTVVLVVVTMIAFGAGAASAEIRFGTLPRLSAAELQTMFAPLADYLARETGEKVTLVIPKDFDAFNRVFREYFKGVQPARTTVEASAPRKGVNVEIDAIAWVPR